MYISKNNLIILVFLTLSLSACQPDPRLLAEADKTRSETMISSAIADQALNQQIALDEITVQEAEFTQVVNEATKPNAVLVAKTRTLWVGNAVSLALVFLLTSAGIGGSVALIGFGQSAARKSLVSANLIYLDKATGQFPQLITYVSKGVYSLTDMNDHSTRLLDTRNDADRLAVQGAMAIRHALVMSSAAAKSRDATGVAMVAPLIIEQEV